MKKLKWTLVPVNTSLECKLSLLQDRAHMLKLARAFFDARHVLEVDCPAISAAAPIDLHIDIMKVILKDASQRYLHTSAEYGMKRLLAAGMGDIYQLSHVYREGEKGSRHNPEFTMVEWYRLNFSFNDFLEETLDFIRLFVGDFPSSIYTYREAFHKFTGIDYLNADIETLHDLLASHAISLSRNQAWDKNSLLNMAMSFIVESHLGQNELTAIDHFPASQAALAKTFIKNDEHVAERFEVYCKGIELANGYHELTDHEEQKKRFEEANQERLSRGKDSLPIDYNFINALASGLPECRGVAVGFDRLMMLRNGKTHIADVIPFAWDLA